MFQTVPNSSENLGNTQNQVLPRQVSPRKNHFFTYNNYKEEEIVPIVTQLKKFAYKGKVQTEIGENGTPHLQGMIWCEKKHRDTEFKLSKKIHWEPLLDTFNVVDYCGKDETHDGKFRTSWGFPKPLKLITPDKDWQKEILALMDTEPDDRKVFWYWSVNGGVGKSQFYKYLLAQEKCIFIDGGAKRDIMYMMSESDMDYKNCVIINIPRTDGNKCCYTSIEAIKDGVIFSPKYESTYKLFNSPHVIVFANKEPIYKKLSKDRWVVKQLDPGAIPEDSEDEC